jgi:membrane-bound lytic murein transglycosylase D
MLKRKLSNAGFLSQGLLLIATPYGLNTKAEAAAALKDRWMDEASAQQSKAVGEVAFVQAPDALMIHAAGLPDSLMDQAPKVPLNPLAASFIKHYIKNNKEVLQLVKDKSEPYFKIIESVFRKYGLPVELKYLAVIESDLDPKARSRVGARGPWQLMPRTARDYGLKVSKKHDDRIIYYKSTVAAAKYIRSLYAEFGDWLLVIAAYNGGDGTVRRAMHRSGSHNFWKMQRYLPAETRGHVKRFIGTHYFFEDQGSITTLTKTEMAEHRKAIAEFISRHNDPKEDLINSNYAGPDATHAAADKAIAEVKSPGFKKENRK